MTRTVASSTRRPRGHPQRRARALFGYLDDALYRDLLAAN
jgi:hypothetical protein